MTYLLHPARQMSLAVADCIVQARAVEWIAYSTGERVLNVGQVRASVAWATDEAREQFRDFTAL